MGAVSDLIIKIIEEQRKSFDLQVIGDRGDGKSMCILRLGEIISQHFGTPFTVDNVHFEAQSFLEHLDRLTRGKDPADVPSGNVLILDESGKSLNAQEWQTREVKAVCSQQEVYRCFRIAVLMSTPLIGNINKRSRLLVSGIMKPLKAKVNERHDLDKLTTNIDRKNNRSCWRFYLPWGDQSLTRGQKSGGAVQLYRPSTKDGRLDKVWMTLPDAKLIADYEAKKARFLEKDRDAHLSKLRGEDGGQQPSQNSNGYNQPQVFDPKPYVDKVLEKRTEMVVTYRRRKIVNKEDIRIMFRISHENAKAVKRATERILNPNRLGRREKKPQEEVNYLNAPAVQNENK